MAKINKNFKKLQKNYLFIDIAKRTKAFIEANPGVTVLRLGIGDTTEPIPPVVIAGMHAGVEKLSKRETYTGYDDNLGNPRLKQAFVDWYQQRGVSLDTSEICIGDGGKPDSGNIQSIFSPKNIIAVSDPVYPVYVDSNVIAGRTGTYANGKYKGVVYMPLTSKNNFIPKVPDVKVDLIYLCSPNNPTGGVMSKKDLERFVKYARKNKSVIIFDSAYSMYIKDSDLPRSIYEIEGAKSCAIEISSFSKWAGFTGVRLGWTIVPKELVSEDSEKGELHAMWFRRQTTMFNGASNIAQEGGIAVLSKQGQKQCQQLVDYYMGNAQLIRNTFLKLGFTVYGGENAPYIWLKTPTGYSSWEFFDKVLSETHIVGTPGSGFGSCGEGYFRLSAFGKRENIEKAVKSIQKNLKL